MSVIGEIDECQNNEKYDRQSNGMNDYCVNNDYSNNGTNGYLNNGRNDSGNYASSVYLNNERNVCRN